MTDEERHNTTQVVGKLFFTMVIVIGALVVAVWALGAKTRADVRSAAHADQIAQTDQLRDGCARGVSRDFEAYDANSDVVSLATDIGRVLQAKDKAAAKRAQDTAENARQRLDKIEERLPVSRHAGDIDKFCRDLYPYPLEK